MVEQNKTQDDLTDDRHTLSNCRLTISGGIIIKPKIGTLAQAGHSHTIAPNPRAAV
jgi:hypothetical protein